MHNDRANTFDYERSREDKPLAAWREPDLSDLAVVGLRLEQWCGRGFD